MVCFETLTTCSSRERLVDEAEHLVKQLGFDLWAFSTRVDTGRSGERPIWSIGNFPADLRQARAECFERLSESPSELMQYGIPYAWLTASEPPQGNPGSDSIREFREVAGRHGVCGGLCVPVPARGDVAASLTLVTTNQVTIEALKAARPSALLFSKYLNLGCQPYVTAFRAECAPRLSPRETECLSWVAMGKTTWEISRVLDISEHTVVYHLRNAGTKLGAVNRQQAIAKSMQLGILAPNGSMAERPRPVVKRVQDSSCAFLG